MWYFLITFPTLCKILSTLFTFCIFVQTHMPQIEQPKPAHLLVLLPYRLVHGHDFFEWLSVEYTFQRPFSHWPNKVQCELVEQEQVLEEFKCVLAFNVKRRVRIKMRSNALLQALRRVATWSESGGNTNDDNLSSSLGDKSSASSDMSCISSASFGIQII